MHAAELQRLVTHDIDDYDLHDRSLHYSPKTLTLVQRLGESRTLLGVV